ncbi:MAG: SBBP repeat-containing protein, partial [Flavobacteriales bacterium]
MTTTLHRAARTILGALLLLLLPALPAAAQRAHHHAHDHGHPAPASHQGHHHDDLSHLLNMHEQEIHFTENKGQFSPEVLFRADFPYGQAVATPQGMVVTTFDPIEVDKRIADGFAIEEEQRLGRPVRDLTWRRRGHAWQLRFIGAESGMKAEGRDAHSEVTNYFVGDRAKHATDVRSFQEVWYRDVYPGIDARYYPAADGSLEYDLLVMPGADASRIAIAHDGIGKMHVNEKGELMIETILGEFAHPAPHVYQRINGRESVVTSRYKVEGDNILRFELGSYDKRHPLVIDPIAMRWATWINTNSSSDNHGHCIWVDPSDGAIYVVARVTGTTDQITPGAFDTTENGALEIIVGKYLEPANVGGSGTRVWQTYIGGGGDDNPYAMEQGPDGNLYITGQTSSTNFPLLGGTAFSGSSINQQAQSGIDVFVLKMNTAGNSIKAAVVGGNGADDNFDVRVAANGDVFVAGSTTSTNLLTLNAGSGASNTNNGGADVLVFRINQDLSSLVWMRNYGGSAADRASIMLHNPATGDLFVGGNTSSTNFPTASPRQATRGGSTAGFLQRLNGTTAATIWSSYYSSASSQNANLLCMEFNTAKDELFFGGVTSGLNSANITTGAYDTSHNGSNDFYVGRMTINQNFITGTYVGGSGDEVNMMGLNTDQNNDVFVFGYSGSSNFPMSTSPNVPLQTTNQGNRDKVFFKLKSALNQLEFSTYYGGSADDYDPVGERGIKFSNCRIYTIVTAQSNNIPLTQGALNTTKNSPTNRYEPGLVVWANPPDLLGNSISYQGVAICPGATPGDIIGSVPSYSLPTVVRNNTASSYPSFGSAASYQWQISPDSL